MQSEGIGKFLGNFLNHDAYATTAHVSAATQLALHVEHLQVMLQDSLQRADGIANLLDRAFIQDSATSALALVDQALTLYNELQEGIDTNGNAVIEPIQGEGGIVLVLEHTGYRANIEVHHIQAP